MTFFVKLIKIFKSIGFVFVLFVVSYVLTSLVYYSNVERISKREEIEIIECEHIEIINVEDVGYINIDINKGENISNEALVAYAFSYYDLKGKEVYIYIYEEETILAVGKNNFAIFEKSRN